MELIKKNLANLLKVKTLVTLCVIGVFVYLSVSGAIASENAMIIISMVVSFYFGTQHEKTGATTVPANAAPRAEAIPMPEAPIVSAAEPVDVSTYNATHPDE